MKTHVAATSICPYCGYLCDRATGEGTPSKDDISICLKCTGLMQFNEDLSLRKIDESAYREMISDDELRERVNEYRKAILANQ